MGMSTYVQCVEGGEAHEAKIEAYNAIKKAGVKMPQELEEYFEEGISKDGKVVEVPQESVNQGSYDSSDYWDVDLSNIPKTVTKIRFVNSY